MWLIGRDQPTVVNFLQGLRRWAIARAANYGKHVQVEGDLLPAVTPVDFLLQQVPASAPLPVLLSGGLSSSSSSSSAFKSLVMQSNL